MNKKENIYEHVGAFPSKLDGDIHDRMPTHKCNGNCDTVERGNRDNLSLGPKAIEFDMDNDASMDRFIRLIERLHNHGIVFNILQDKNLIFINL